MFILGLQIVLFCLNGLIYNFLGVQNRILFIFIFDLLFCMVLGQCFDFQLCSELIFCNLMNDLCVF